MREISEKQVVANIRRENIWWETTKLSKFHSELSPRPYLRLFYPLVYEKGIRRAVVLMGPRRVGKSVLVHHTIGKLLKDGVQPKMVVYLSVDHPIYNGLSLEKLVQLCGTASGVDYLTEDAYIFFDEIQYLKEWEVHLKSLVDQMPNIKAIATGSAAAALKLKSRESGAGRFTDFLLPPLTFYEYLNLTNKSHLVQVEHAGDSLSWTATDQDLLNIQFAEYANFGGYPEVVTSALIRSDPARYIKNDIIDKVLLRDLPSLYGIEDIQELNYLFTTLAYNTADEVSLNSLSQGSGISKNTISKYIEYLEAAFLIRKIHRIDRSGKSYKRANFFKIYLTNPSMRSALFSPVSVDSGDFGHMAETAIFSQYFHSDISTGSIYYARWQSGEVDIVRKSADQSIYSVVEVKWSNRFFDDPKKLRVLTSFCKHNKVKSATVTTVNKFGSKQSNGVELDFRPASLFCYAEGYRILHYLDHGFEQRHLTPLKIV